MARLEIEGLRIERPGADGPVPLVDGLDLAVGEGEVVGLLGESGSGKSLTALAVPRLLPPGVALAGGTVRLDGRDLGRLGESELRRVRGREIGLVFQEPAAALDPLMTIGAQLVETIRAHERMPRGEARARSAALLAEVGLGDGGDRLERHPHQLSGGERQRVGLALALAADPRLLVADEPTSALDAVLGAEILNLLAKLRRDRGLAVLLITHDLAVASRLCDRAALMVAGEVVEEGPLPDLFERAAHPYTRALLAVAPRLGADRRTREPLGPAPEPGAWAGGCRFHPRCALAEAICAQEAPRETERSGGGHVRCWAVAAGEDR